MKLGLVVDQVDLCLVRTAEETEEYQRVSQNVGKGLAVIQEELQRMRLATKAQVESLAIQREVRSQEKFPSCIYSACLKLKSEWKLFP